MAEIVLELVVIIALVNFNITVAHIDAETEYTKREREWICSILSFLTVEIAGFTLFRAGIIGIGSSSRTFGDFLLNLIAY